MSFIQNETGAVTVDWVVLTAGLVGLGLAVMTVVSSGTQDLGTDIDENLSGNIVSVYFLGSEEYFLDTNPLDRCASIECVEQWGADWVAAGSTWQRVVDDEGFKQAHLDYREETFGEMTQQERIDALNALNLAAGSAYDAETDTLNTNMLLHWETSEVSRPAFHLLDTLMLEAMIAENS